MEIPRLQPLVGWLLLVVGAAGLAYGGWRLLDAIANQQTASPAEVGTSASAGTLWALLLVLLLPSVVFAYAGVALLRRPAEDGES